MRHYIPTILIMIGFGVFVAGAQVNETKEAAKPTVPEEKTIVDRAELPKPQALTTTVTKEVTPDDPVERSISQRLAANHLLRNIRHTELKFETPEALIETDPETCSALGSSDDELFGTERMQILDSDKRKFNWKPALLQSGLFLAIQHGVRTTEEKTRREFSGKFFEDWGNSVKNLRGWDDGGKFFTNYITHPMQGAISARIFINNSEDAKRSEVGLSGDYLKSRLKAMAWSALLSTQFELGPISEASIGNVGLHNRIDGKSKMTWGDLIVTPVLGTAVTMLEDTIDKVIFVNWLERKTRNHALINCLRVFLTPTTAFANVLRFRTPWRRDDPARRKPSKKNPKNR